MKKNMRIVVVAMAAVLAMNIYILPPAAHVWGVDEPESTTQLSDSEQIAEKGADDEMTSSAEGELQETADSINMESPEPSMEPDPSAAPEPSTEPNPSAAPEPSMEPNPSAVPKPSTKPEPSAVPEPSAEPNPSAAPELSMESETQDAYGDEEQAVYQDGVILLYTYEQLCAVGSGRTVMTGDAQKLGSGQSVLDAQGESVTYGLDARYKLMNDIPLDGQAIWVLPEGFTGHFVSDPDNDERALYDNQNDAIYIYHNYQLLTIASGNGEQEPVMSKDSYPEWFGVGDFIFPETAPDAEFMPLTYDPSNTYLLSRNFTEQMPQNVAAMVSSGIMKQELLSGYEYLDTIEIDGIKYIVLANEVELETAATGISDASMLFVRTTASTVVSDAGIS